MVTVDRKVYRKFIDWHGKVDAFRIVIDRWDVRDIVDIAADVIFKIIK